MQITLLGLGYVGLPVACAFAKAGVTVYGVDKNIDLINALNSKKYNYTEKNLNKELDLYLNKTLFVSDKITKSDTYIITVQTPVDKNHNADNTFVEKALEEVSKYVKNDDLIILESTVPIGSNENFYNILRSSIDEKIHFNYCYCPESILPGNIFFEIATNSRVLGGIDEESAKKAQKIYNYINSSPKELTDIKTAEYVKLTQNAHRDVELAFVNQLSIMCEAEGVDVFKVIEIANKHPRCNLLMPGSGVGGHCIAVDPYFFIERYKENASLIKEARKVNSYKPIWVAKKAIIKAKSINNLNIGVLGLSYKANCEDCRESSGIEIVKYLKEHGCIVYSNEINSNQKYINGIENISVEKVLEKCDVIIIAQKHDKYLEYNYDNKILIDTINIFR